MSLVTVLLALSFIYCASGYKYKTLWFDQKIDNFNYVSNATYKQRYLVNADDWNSTARGPIFFYTGNEGDIVWFAENTGFMWDIKNEFNAVLVFAEHRYYGESMPYGNESFSSPEKLQYLNTQQALADFAELINHLAADRQTGRRILPVVGFGGSYGGMLTAYFRMKYPHLMDGGVASSAPILQFTGMAPCSAYNDIVSAAFRNTSQDCAHNIRKSWDILEAFNKTRDAGSKLQNIFHLCNPVNQTNPDWYITVRDWLSSTYSYLSMVNYPYEANFLQPLPAWPIKEFCKPLNKSFPNDEALLGGLYEALNVYYNYTGNVSCLNLNETTTDSLSDNGWNIQACTEMVMPMCDDGKSGIYFESHWNETEYTDECDKQHGLKPNYQIANLLYGGRHIKASSNIVFPNGLLDPWSGGGVLESLSDSLIAIIIPEGAHHLDLRSANPKDPESVVSARKLIRKHIHKWIKHFRDETMQDLPCDNNVASFHC